MVKLLTSRRRGNRRRAVTAVSIGLAFAVTSLAPPSGWSDIPQAGPAAAPPDHPAPNPLLAAPSAKGGSAHKRKPAKKRVKKKATSKPKHHRGGTANPVLFGADDANYDDQTGILIARGNVELTQNNRTVLADAVSYDQRTDTLEADGNVAIIRESGDILFADHAQLSNEMKDGFLKNMRMLMADRSRMAGNAARRTNGDRTEIRRGVYSPCDLCADDPTAAPIWQLRASTIIHNQTQKLIEYRDVSLELFGVPLLYSPYLSHPDPSVKRASGFLAPTFGSSSSLGAHATIPFFWVISPDSDLTISPIFTTDEGAVAAGGYRQRFRYGYLDIKGSFTNATDIYTSNAAKGGVNQMRGHLFAEGAFDLNDQFRTGFDIQRASDQTYLRVYDFSQTVSYLPSHAYLEDFAGRDYGSIDAYSFQPLIQGESSRTQPWVLPVIDYTWNGTPMAWGGKFTTAANASDIFRQSGTASRRFSVGTELDYPFRTSNGMLFNALAAIRGDAYYVSYVPISSQNSFGNVITKNYTGGENRLFPQLGLEWRYPFVRYNGGSRILVEPRVAFYAAPNNLNSAKLPDDDSLTFDYSETDLFQRNRFSGYDRVDQGQRVDYGLHTSWSAKSGMGADALIGQSYRLQKASIFEAGTGLDEQRSDYVGRIRFNPASFLNLTYRFRNDGETFASQRQEVSGAIAVSPVTLSVGYTYITPNPREALTAIHQVSAGISLKLDQYWTAGVGGVHSLGSGTANLSNSVTLSYQDECILFQTSLTQTGTHDRDLQAGTSVLFQFVFKNLGEIGLPSLRPFSTSSSS